MKTRKIAVLVLSLAMVLMMGTSVFAVGANSANGEDGSYAANEASLVKYFKAPLGVTLPEEETFTFNFTPQDSTGAYGVKASEFTSTSATVALTAMTAEDADENQNKIGTVAVSSIFDKTKYTFPHAGEYVFEVSEDASANTSGMTYSTETYTLHLIVDRNLDITDVTVANEDGEKVDPTDVDPTDNDDPTPSASNGGFTFTNTFTKTVSTHEEPQDPNPDPDPEDPSNPDPIVKDDPKTGEAGAFELDKFVLGQYGDTTKGFTFTIDVELPELNKDFDYAAEASQTITNNTVTLKHGETFVFDELPVGTKITVGEAAVDGYTVDWTTPNNDNGLTVLITENGGYAICRNSFNDEAITPTGIIINNLPYILLIAIALGGIVLFARKRRYE